ncbi:MAG: hypothetical protein JST54_15625 [Deltaproteobacteria bacterium]|nr:hypothetical protein [Deltaproteobacteria bacterium]
MIATNPNPSFVQVEADVAALRDALTRVHDEEAKLSARLEVLRRKLFPDAAKNARKKAPIS